MSRSYVCSLQKKNGCFEEKIFEISSRGMEEGKKSCLKEAFKFWETALQYEC